MFSGIASALDAYLNTFDRGTMDIVFGEQTFSPDETKGYLSAKVSGYNRTAMGVGADSLLQEVGSYTIAVNKSGDEGRDRAAWIADQIAAFFPRGLILQSPLTGQSLIIEVSSVMPTIVTGTWVRVPVVVNWLSSEV